LNQTGKTVVLSTHRLSDVEQMCTHIAILTGGRLAHSGPLPSALAPHSQVLIQVDRLPNLIAWQLSQLHPAVMLEGTNISLPGDAVEIKPTALRLLLDAKIDILRVEDQRTTLEDIYLEAVQTEGRR
jgi:ABC-2 type transport system ATP-binding protein